MRWGKVEDIMKVHDGNMWSSPRISKNCIAKPHGFSMSTDVTTISYCCKIYFTSIINLQKPQCVFKPDPSLAIVPQKEVK